MPPPRLAERIHRPPRRVLVVLLEVLGHTQRQASRLTPAAITPTEDELLIDGAPIPTRADLRGCPACATVRWLEVCDLADGLGQAIARENLSTTGAPRTTCPHIHLPRHQRWRDVPFLAISIDQHGRLVRLNPYPLARSAPRWPTLAPRPETSKPTAKHHRA